LYWRWRTRGGGVGVLDRAVTITVTIAVGTEDVVIAAAIAAIAHQALMIPRAPSRGHSIGATVLCIICVLYLLELSLPRAYAV
jgi:hypothetical protein